MLCSVISGVKYILSMSVSSLTEPRPYWSWTDKIVSKFNQIVSIWRIHQRKSIQKQNQDGLLLNLNLNCFLVTHPIDNFSSNTSKSNHSQNTRSIWLERNELISKACKSREWISQCWLKDTRYFVKVATCFGKKFRGKNNTHSRGNISMAFTGIMWSNWR